VARPTGIRLEHDRALPKPARAVSAARPPGRPGRVKRLLLIGGALAGLWAWLRGRRREATDAEAPATVTPITPTPPPAEPAPAAEADQAVREAESRLDDETKYERAAGSEAEERHDAAERLKDDSVARRSAPPDDAA
jgi:hypothetical protein